MSEREESALERLDRLEREAMEEDNRCSGCQAWIPKHRDFCDSCAEEDRRTFGGDAA